MLIFSLLFLSKFTCRTLVLIPYHLLSQRVQTRGLKGKLLVRSLMMKSSITELWLKFWLERILKSCVTILLRIKVLIQKWMLFQD